jgi:hypothetical protein
MWWREFWSRVSSPEWVADVGVGAFLAIVTIAVAVWVLRRQLHSDAATRAADLNREKAQDIGKMLIQLGEEMGGSRSRPDFFPPAHDDIFWGTNRFPGAPIMEEIAWTRPEVRTACADITELLVRGQRLWYCCRSPVLPQELWVDEDNRITFVQAWTRSRETGLYSIAQCLYQAGSALREWDGTLPWRNSPLLNLVKLRLYGIPDDGVPTGLARGLEPRAMKLHAGRTETALRKAGLEHVVSELQWPQAAQGAIERHIRDESFFNDPPSKTLITGAHLDTSTCRPRSPLKQDQNLATYVRGSGVAPGYRSGRWPLRFAPMMCRRTLGYATCLAITIIIAVWVLRRQLHSETVAQSSEKS